MRKIVGIAMETHQRAYNVMVVAICDDGSAWELVEGKWGRLPPIPQDDYKPVRELTSREAIKQALQYLRPDPCVESTLEQLKSKPDPNNPTF